MELSKPTFEEKPFTTIAVRSGQLLIVDPSYLNGVEGGKVKANIAAKMANPSALLPYLEMKKRELTDTYTAMQVYGSPPEYHRRITDDISEITDRITQIRQAAQKELPSTLVSFDRYIFLQNPPGDGESKVARSSGGRIRVIYGPQRGGKLVGRSSLPTKAQLITDAENVEVDAKILPHNFARIKVENGIYYCSLEGDDSQALLIRRALGRSEEFIEEEGLTRSPSYVAQNKPKGIEKMLEENRLAMERKLQQRLRRYSIEF